MRLSPLMVPVLLLATLSGCSPTPSSPSGSSAASSGGQGGHGPGGGAGGQGSGSGGASSSSSAGGAPAAPTFSADCAANNGQWDLVQKPGASIKFGVMDPMADDNAACELVLPGDPALGPADHVGPGFATEIDSKVPFSFGTYRARVKLAACSPSEEVVNGIFTYFNDGLDHNGNGLADNAEIDIEILCGQPNYILLSSWTDYDDGSGKFLKWSRAVDTATGDYLESPSDHEYGLNPVGNLPEFKHPGFPDPNAFYEMGFEWHAAHIRFFIVLDGQEITLWDFKDQKLIPQLEAPFLFNVWHPADHWYEGGAPDYPAKDAAMRIDWFKYWSAPM